MLAAMLRTVPGEFVVDDVALQATAEREVLIETAAAGLCHSDLHYSQGLLKRPLPVVMGHEGAGVVLEVGSNVTNVSPGDRVVVCPSSCRKCPECWQGRPQRCTGKASLQGPGGSRLHGASGETVYQASDLGTFAERMLVHDSSVIAVPDGVSLELAAVMGCAVTTGLGAVFNTARVKAGETVAVIGCGGIGLNIVQAAVIAGARQVIAIDTQSSKLAMATDFGATDVIDASSTDPVASVLDLTNGGVDHAFEAVGRAESTRQAWQMLATFGTATVAGVLPADTELRLPAEALLREVRLQGCYMGSSQFAIDLPRYFSLYRQGRLKVDELVSKRYELTAINDGYADLLAGSLARGVLVFPSAGSL